MEAKRTSKSESQAGVVRRRVLRRGARIGVGDGGRIGVGVGLGIIGVGWEEVGKSKMGG